MFCVKKATIDDRFLIHYLASKTWENTYKNILSKEQIDYMFDLMYAPQNILKQMEVSHHQYFIFYHEEQPVGYLSIEQTDEHTFNFQKIYTLPEIQGKGLGRFIIEYGIEYLKGIHPKTFTIELFVNRYNHAVDFYRHMGLKEIGTRDFPIGNNFYMNDYIMAMEVKNNN